MKLHPVTVSHALLKACQTNWNLLTSNMRIKQRRLVCFLIALKGCLLKLDTTLLSQTKQRHFEVFWMAVKIGATTWDHRVSFWKLDSCPPWFEVDNTHLLPKFLGRDFFSSYWSVWYLTLNEITYNLGRLSIGVQVAEWLAQMRPGLDSWLGIWSRRSKCEGLCSCLSYPPSSWVGTLNLH